MLMRFIPWMVAAVLSVSALIYWGNGFDQIMEDINNVF
jgi:hypothetical protein